MKYKSKTFEKFKKFKAEVEKQLGKSIKTPNQIEVEKILAKNFNLI